MSERPRYRKVSCQIHDDVRFRGWSDDGKLLFLCLLTHPGLMAGVLRTHPAMLAAERGWTQSRLDKAMLELGDRVLVEPAELAVGLPNWIRHNVPDNPSMATALGKLLREAPQGTVREEVARRSESWLRSEMGDTWAEAWLRGVGTRVGTRVAHVGVEVGVQQEQEQEQEQDKDQSARGRAPARGDSEFSTRARVREADPPGAGKVSRTELQWRVERCWEAHLAQRRGFYLDAAGLEPPMPALNSEVREAIEAALMEYDRDRLGAEDRERWEAESPVRAAGVGLFLDPFLTGQHKDNDARNGGKRYLESWRPWKRQKGKPDPVPRFAELYWMARGVAQAARPA